MKNIIPLSHHPTFSSSHWLFFFATGDNLNPLPQLDVPPLRLKSKRIVGPSRKISNEPSSVQSLSTFNKGKPRTNSISIDKIGIGNAEGGKIGTGISIDSQSHDGEVDVGGSSDMDPHPHLALKGIGTQVYTTTL